VTYDCKALICEVCREPLPHSAMINGQETEILAPERPQSPIPYMILYRIEKTMMTSKESTLFMAKVLMAKYWILQLEGEVATVLTSTIFQL